MNGLDLVAILGGALLAIVIICAALSLTRGPGPPPGRQGGEY